jgi:predicted transcriptional regulator
LYRGKEFVDGVFELEDSAGAGTAESDELLNAGLSDADEGELGSHKEAAGQDEKGHHDYAEEHPLKH